MSLRKPFIVLLLSAALSSPLSAQSGSGQTDSVVTLMNAKLLEQYEDEEGMQFRKAIDARFLHNNTYLICDTAFWNVSRRLINAIGHVQIIQDRTVLSSDNLDYVIDDNLAQFRGSQVQLLDKEGNTLRTRFLDYNTKDSIAVFRRGGSMRDKDGQVIESTEGTYDSKEKLFTFNRNVNMYTDSVYIKTNRLLYHTDYDFAEFFGGLDAWKGHNMMSSEDGSYDKANDRFFFTIDVHMMSDTQEGWADSLYFDRTRNDLEMYGNVQVMDTTRNVSALSERLFYVDTLSQVTLERNATVVARTDQGGQIDTVYMAADRMVYHTVPKCDIDGNIVEMAGKRLADLSVDAVSSYRARATSAAPESGDGGQEDISEEEEEEEEDLPDISANAADAPVDSLQIDVNTLSPMEGADSLGVAEPVPVDSVALAEKARMDSLAARELFIADSLKNRDTTAIGFLTATGHIRVFKSDMQARCDSLEYSDLDSLARLFISPIVWNEGNRQYTSDSLTVAIKNQRMDKASLMSDAFIIIQEDSICFDQIKGTEILAYFDSTTALERFDALGGSQALFYLRENDAFATVNKVEARMISANFVDGEIDRIYYFENPKNDAYPVVQLPPEEKEMKGFNWQPETRPKGKQDITALELRKSERITYLARPMPRFDETNTYFPGHMKSIAKKLAEADSLRRVRHAEARERQALAELEAAQDSLLASVPADTLAVPKDSLGMTVSPKDSLEARLGQPGPGQPSDSLATIIAGIEPVTPGEPERELTPEEQRAAKKAETEAKRQARVDAREARWAELDARDAAKAAAKEAKALEKKRKATLRAVLAAEKEAARDQKRLEKYIRKYEKQKARREARKGARKDAPGDAQSKDTLEETL
jgi:lipopolysaccharide export system protein LptA